MWKLTFLSICLLLAIDCQGKIITVDDDKPADFNSIQAAIDDVNTIDGDKIVVSEGTYYESINTNGKAITIRSTNHLDSNTVLNTIIDSNGSGYCITVDSGEDTNTVIKGFLITGVGGGIYCYNSSPTITNCSISGNSEGHTMFCLVSNPTLTNCIFSGNSASGDGGGMVCGAGNPTLTNCIFSGNSANYDGGGMSCSNSNPKLTNCTFSGNSAPGSGGGMYCLGGCNPALNNCTLIGNSANDYGGGIYSESSNPILTDSFLCGNFISGTSTLSQIEGSFTDNGGNFINDACPPPVAKTEGDLDGDGDVDFDDFAIFANNWLEGVG